MGVCSRRGELRGQWAESYRDTKAQGSHETGLRGFTLEAGQGRGQKRVEGEEFDSRTEQI